ncbi:hypothetical protein Cgig2_009717 [Carnegiea gigantea]|uniref:Lactation elevated protein 1 n=1 Tax=Carnegiea gigantea TaxID=171969 RepID=A0A9Q1K5F5_9CARY|nr:hypothetical protein Cgig2_009717 [Carnegiea gigantea]
MMKRVFAISCTFSRGFVRRNRNFRIDLIRFSASTWTIKYKDLERNSVLSTYEDYLYNGMEQPPITLLLYLGPLPQYKNLVEQGKLQHDPYQERVASELENLLRRLEQYEKDVEDYHARLSSWEKRREDERRKLLMEEAEQKQQSDVWVTLKKKRNKLVENWNMRKPQDVEPGVGKWVSYLNREKKLNSLVGPCPVAPLAPKGLYLYGNVGSGKTMLMDMFYGATEGVVKHRRRLHFHEAMLGIHEHMHKVWKKQMEEKTLQSSISGWIMNLPVDTKIKEWLAAEEQYKREVEMQNILPTVADKFLLGHQEYKQGATLLCFDEIQTVDVFAIVALSGILSRLLSTGSVLVATSNRAPQDLNQDGMQKEIFQKLVEKMEEHCHIVPIGSDIDYRRLIAQKSVNQVHYFYPLDSKALQQFEKMWSDIISQYGGVVTSETILVMFGRTLDVPESCKGVARFSFDYLCGRAVGAADYISVANKYHTVFISDIPVMSMRIRDKEKRNPAVGWMRNAHVMCCPIFSTGMINSGSRSTGMPGMDWLAFAVGKKFPQTKVLNLDKGSSVARRFITLVDELYNHHCRLVCSAASSIEDLFQGTEEGTLFDLESFQFETEIEGSKLRRDVLAEGSAGSGGSSTGIISLLSGQEEMFAFRRAVSRLIEMQTPFYLEGVRYLHPYFQIQPSNHENDLARTGRRKGGDDSYCTYSILILAVEVLEMALKALRDRTIVAGHGEVLQKSTTVAMMFPFLHGRFGPLMQQTSYRLPQAAPLSHSPSLTDAKNPFSGN